MNSRKLRIRSEEKVEATAVRTPFIPNSLR
jgi:hypothetical protein